ncbi:hypothetical protein J8M20_04585 [Pseudoalteromonas luteoviolacea]|nr:hypothetical protein [Pseudoalteromonas luteoviolacea]
MEHLPLPKPPKSCVFRLVPNSHLLVSKTNNASEVWIADNPDHIIHFNGDRFLGPHENKPEI